MRKTVFVSSTYKDLVNHRDDVRKVLEDFNVNINGMEDFGSRKTPPLETCLSEVDNSNIYIGIIAMNYGSVDENTGKSFTELEYDRALLMDLDIHIFMIDNVKGQIETGNIDFENYKKLEALKNILRSRHTCKSFINKIDLAQSIFELMKELTKDEIYSYKRPPILKADIFSFTINERQCNIVVGKYNGRPTEIYTLIHDDNYDFLDTENEKDFKIIREMHGSEEIISLEFKNKLGYRTTMEGINLHGDSDFRQFDSFLSAILRSDSDKKTIKTFILQMEDNGFDLADWKEKIISVL